jgi:hypothetical protein
VRIDEDLPPRLLRSISVDLSTVRAELDQEGLVFDDRIRPPRPDLEALEATASQVIARAARKAGVGGAVSGAAGAFGVPPETAARLVQSLRLAQRLAIIYGHDPRSDRGQLLIRRALAQAYEVDLPQQASVGFKVSDLKGWVRSGVPAIHDGSLWFVRVLFRKAATNLGKRITRIIPGVGAGVGAWSGHETFLAQGNRMHAVFVRSWDGGRVENRGFEDAVEVR